MRAHCRSVVLVLCLAAAGLPQERPTVAVLPLGEVDPKTLKTVAAAIERALDVEVRIEPSRPLPKEAWYAPRKRWRAEKLIRSVEAAPPSDAWKVVVVTDEEISTTKGDIHDWGIGGLGLIDGRTCVVSSHLIRSRSRTRAEQDERLAKLAVHELGHTLGLDHCPVFACVMNDAKGKLIRSLDASTGKWCGRCAQSIEGAFRTSIVRRSSK